MNEMPQFMSSSYGLATSPAWGGAINDGGLAALNHEMQQRRMMELINGKPGNQLQPVPQPIAKEQQKMASRIVKVFMADTDENVPAEKRILYVGEEKFTDSTDQELFFEIPVQDILTKHNAYRLTLTDKKASAKAGKDVMLEPLRIRDLRMVVVNVAQF
jgi:hypothetical protein